MELLRQFAALYLKIFKKFHVSGVENIPDCGPLILVANHTAAYDPICLQVACKHRFIRFMEAREYYNVRILHQLFRVLRVIPVNRTGNDIASIREAVRELSNNGCIGIFPEGRISTDGQIHIARKGVALLALMTNAVVVPAYFQATQRYSGMIRDFFRFNSVTLHIGRPIHFDDIAGKHRQEACREVALKRIMDAIVELQKESTPSIEAGKKREVSDGR
jgi:1-acyl-sn-glycerol-3-phosphate acyltransferase